MTNVIHKKLKAYENIEFLKSRDARTIRILSEYLEPEKRFREHNIQHTVVFFGSARTLPGKEDKFGNGKYYDDAEEFAYRISMFGKEIEKETGEGITICTGGGGGIMEAANRGSERASRPNIALNISLPFEQQPNPYATPELSFEFHYFFMRKLWFLYQAKAVIVFPGGFGTIDELFETLTLVQTKKLEKVDLPVLLYNREFWKNLINFDYFLEKGMISSDDLKLINFFDTPEEGMDIIKPRLKKQMENYHHYLEEKFPI
jgi:uncharacterized protein (TIGR00730 family)